MDIKTDSQIIWATEEMWRQIKKKRRKLKKVFLKGIKGMGDINKVYFRKLDNLKITIITWTDKIFPICLQTICIQVSKPEN